jgi:DNA-binding NarL/FixJ family response regulator
MSPGPGSTSVVLATDSSFVGDGLASQLAGVAGISVVGRTRNYLDLFDMVEDVRPQAAIISIRSTVVGTMPTIVVARQLRQEFLELGIVIISEHDEACVLEAIRDGASRIAFLLDERLLDLTTVLSALHEVCAGQSVLDPSIVDSLVSHYEGVPVNSLCSREPEVLEQMAKGLSNRAIASELHISIKAIEKDVTAIFRKLELVDRTLVDRRVTASLAFLRTLTNPFESDGEPGLAQPRSTHIVVPNEVAGRL